MAEGQTPERAQPRASRMVGVDALRGLIIVLMALDHANYFVAQKHRSGEYWRGLFPAYSDPLAFLTRLVTHPAAPGFVFLMGAGMALFAQSRRARGWSRWAVTRFFLIRGAVLIALQLLVVNRAWELSPGGWGLNWYFGVLVALGGGMILGSLLVWLKPPYLLGLALALLIVAELLTPGPGQSDQLFSLPVNVLFIPGGQPGWWVSYPILQWLELVPLGLAFGQWLGKDPRRAFRWALLMGGAFLAVFVVVRFLDGFGNIRPMAGKGWMDVFNVVKYPPSISFTALTMGVNLILLGLFVWAGERFEAVRLFLQPLAVFGRAPLFFYVTHLFLYAGLGYLLAPDGTSILAMYPYWIVGLLLLFPFCLWYGQLKQGQPAYSPLRFL